MKAIRVHEFGGPEVLRLEDLPSPKPGPGQTLVEVQACGVNYIDIYHRTGQYRAPLPFPIGQEGAGVVKEKGSGVSEVRVGDRVAWTGIQGSYATHVLVPAARLVGLPSALTFNDGAAAMLQGMTAHYLAYSTYPLKAGDACLVHAAAGGVGLLLCQIAKRTGARVIGTVSTAEKARLAREAGADEVINYREQDFEAQVKRLTDGKGVQVVYDSVGKDTFDRSLNCLAPRGYMVLFGQSSGAVPPVDPQILNTKGSLFLTRPTLASYTASRNELLQRAGDVLGWIASGQLKVKVWKTFPLAEAADAQRQLASRATAGKLLLVP